MKRSNVYIHNVTPEQQKILCWLALFTILTKKHMQKLLRHKDHKWVSVCISRLQADGYVKEVPFTFGRTKIFALSTKGMLLVKRINTTDTQHKQIAKNISFAQIDRFLCIADVYVQLNENSKDTLSFIAKANLSRESKIITPDAYLTYTESTRIKTYFLELDRETQSMNPMEKKLERYSQYFYSKQWKRITPDHFPAVCIICFTQERKRNLMNLAEDLFNTSHFAPIVFKFTTLDEINNGTQKDICLVPFEKKLYPIL